MENGNGRKRVKLVSSRSPDTEVQGKIDSAWRRMEGRGIN